MPGLNKPQRQGHSVKRQYRGLLCGAVAALLAPAAVPASAQTHAAHHAAAATTGPNDYRCLLFAMNMAASPDQNAKTVGFMGVAYYLGKLDGGAGHGDLEAHMEAEINQMRLQKVVPGPIAQACGQELQGRMQAISTVGQQLQQKLAPQAPAPEPAPVLKPIPSPQSH